MKGIVYKGVRLMPGSESLELLEAWKYAKSDADRKAAKERLDAHMEQLDKQWKKLEGRA